MIQQEGKPAWMRRGATALLAAALAGLPVAPAMAAAPDFAEFRAGRQLSDAELGSLRGRFVDQGRLMFFGVQMTSEWRTAQGEHLQVQGHLQGDLRGRVPTVSFEPRLTQVTAGAPSGGGPAGNGATVRDVGTGNARGVVQTIQAGGDFNAAANDLQIEVRPATDHPGRVEPAPGSNTTRRLASGTRLSVHQGPEGVGVGMEMPGMGRVTQTIVPDRGLRQSIQLTSDLQQVRNLTQLQLYLDDRGMQAGTPGVRAAIEAARRLGH
ncbi:hypothetical protein [Halomonas cerina]|uniref:Uncharacterized protein n=1 Tax=Halomonas cerina TaxID=447424 RepID=A0A839V7Y1_9GAMM|nr:hypothetical protein [Halomonas cerina]MBB3188827.1 hypothetical protein [Halomonas cerina]